MVVTFLGFPFTSTFYSPLTFITIFVMAINDIGSDIAAFTMGACFSMGTCFTMGTDSVAVWWWGMILQQCLQVAGIVGSCAAYVGGT